MSLPVPDDKLQAVVNLVLQAVDQRLNTVREQMIQLARSVAHNQSELQRQINECRAMCTAAGQLPGSSETSGASQQVVDIANSLAQHVAQFEARISQQTGERFAELAARIDAIGSGATGPISQPVAVIAAPVATVPGAQQEAISPALARLAPLAAIPREPATPTFSVATAPVAAQVAPSAPSAPVAPVAPAEAGDLDALTAMMNERLSAAIERALGVSS